MVLYFLYIHYIYNINMYIYLLKSGRSRMGVLYLYICICISAITMALWQLRHLRTWCALCINHAPKCMSCHKDTALITRAGEGGGGGSKLFLWLYIAIYRYGCQKEDKVESSSQIGSFLSFYNFIYKSLLWKSTWLCLCAPFRIKPLWLFRQLLNTI